MSPIREDLCVRVCVCVLCVLCVLCVCVCVCVYHRDPALLLLYLLSYCDYNMDVRRLVTVGGGGGEHALTDRAGRIHWHSLTVLAEYIGTPNLR
jgi:hypothetical protein